MAERRTDLLTDRSLRTFWLARLLDRAADWLFLLALLIAAWTWTFPQDTITAAWVLVAWLAPRLIVWGLLTDAASRLAPVTWSMLAALRALAICLFLLAGWLNVLDESQLMLIVAVAFGALAALSAETRSTALRARLGLSDLGAGVAADTFLERLAIPVAALAAAVIAFSADTLVASIAAAALLIVAALIAFTQVRSLSTPARGVEDDADPLDPDQMREMARNIVIYLVGAFTAGALGGALLIATLTLGQPDSLFLFAYVPPVLTPVLILAYGLGMVVGPLPVPRMLLRVPAPLILLVGAAAAAALVVAIVLSRTDFQLLMLPLLFLLGLIAATMDTLRAIAIRRLAPPTQYVRAARVSLLALTVGQIYGALVIVSLANSSDAESVLVLIAITQLVLVGLAVLVRGRNSLQVGGLSSLPVKSVVHRLSWATRPPASPADFAERAPRARRLARWMGRTVDLEELTVVLPVSGREYTVYRPDEESRERLFEAGRADPEKQMPYWAKVWPSGVALADVVVERKEEVADKHVLELGAGLGVTACVVLEYGGHLVTADYSALPLAHCRLSTLVNTDRAPRATRFNWRHEDEVADVAEQPEFKDGFPLIIAGDVLYEGRDAEPLLNVIDSMLVDDGALWLAEPVRRTAQRFLDQAAALGWQIDSRQVTADWPDDTDGPVNLHFLTRSPAADRITADLGGWRI